MIESGAQAPCVLESSLSKGLHIRTEEKGEMAETEEVFKSPRVMQRKHCGVFRMKGESLNQPG